MIAAFAAAGAGPVRADFGSIRATSLAADDVDQYIEQRVKAGHAKASINRTTQLLKQAYILAELPAPKIRKLDETDNKRRGFFTETEVRNVLSSLSSELSDFTLFAWVTGNPNDHFVRRKVCARRSQRSDYVMCNF